MPAPSALNPWLDQHYASPQTLVKVGRQRRLNLLIAGEGAPTVVFASGLIGTTLDWARVQPAVALRTRTVAFDKAGLGFSDPGPMPRTASAIVADLRAALRAAAITPPYVLVGHSAGGPQMRLFAVRHPQEVVGLVMVDSAREGQYRRFDEALGEQGADLALRADLVRTYGRLARLARAGALVPGAPDYERAVGPPSPALTQAVQAARVDQRLSPAYWRALRSEAASADGQTADAASPAEGSCALGDVPLVVLTAERSPQPRAGEGVAAAAARRQVWLAMQDEIASLSTRGQRRTVARAGHAIQLEQPEAVIAAIEEVLALAGSN